MSVDVSIGNKLHEIDADSCWMSNSIELDPVCMVKKLMFNVHLMFTTSKSKKRFDCLSTNNLTTKPVEQFPIGNIHMYI